ncbi:uncharacterized protein LOC126734191 [Anthonomus grandis grandis]|uniref:uncharacterized protein LOC126734191 n=1 Tax=Anthonomus grandis grandis TaxID=2921223 RepID=UPI002165F846|nr:uncharacterized protein LOC126734191 [Anthonomus grandis grandis]
MAFKWSIFLMTCNSAFILAYTHVKTDELHKSFNPATNVTSTAGPHPCSRKCVYGESMVCQYHFKVENYYTMTKACHDCPMNLSHCYQKDCIPGDGYERGIITVNRQMPGPAIEVCQNDLIIVDVENSLMSEGTTIHWHGQHQRDTPYMDGVPYVTQCPILPKNTFRYSFIAKQAGTHFWHSHLGMQRVDGCYGPLIVRIPEDYDPHDPLYDFDLSSHIMMLIDWERVTGMEKFLYHHHSIGDNKPTTLLVNGHGRFKEFVDRDNSTYNTPLARFTVEQGYRYRFRVINAGFLNCPIEISVDNHKIKVISTDGSDISPIEADSLVTYAGERFDFVLSADQPKSLYWIRFRGLMDCDERFRRAHQMAVLEYAGFENVIPNIVTQDYQSLLNKSTYNAEKESKLINDVKDALSRAKLITNRGFADAYATSDKEILPEGDPNYFNSKRIGKQINSLNKGTEASSCHVAMPDLSSLEKWDYSLKFKPDYQIFLAYDFYRLNNKHFHGYGYEFNNVTNPSANQLFTPQINHISMEMPTFALLPQRDQIDSNMFCNENTIRDKDCSATYCECPHAYQIPLNSVVELVIVDEGFAFDANHPLHLHGYNFRVVAMEKIGSNVTVEQVKQRDRKGLIKRNLIDAPIKDTVTVPDGGYTVIRFQASNPGYWLFHCHLEFHAEIGMALVFIVGENYQMPAVPQGFPQCGNYIPMDSFPNLPQAKPLCSKNSFVNKFEKVIFGEYCEDVPASSSDVVKSSEMLLLLSVLFSLFAVSY